MTYSKTMINGNTLEDKIPGYMTLNVFGREMLGKENTTQKVDGKDGVSHIESSLPPRTLTVEYWIKANNYKDLKSKFELLNYYLSENQLEIVFTDDEKYKWIGTLDSAEDTENYTRFRGSTFNILCSDPYKYSNDIKQLSGLDSITFSYFNMYPILPDEIRLVLKEDGNTINFKNTTKAKNIILNSTFTIGQEIVIKPRNQEITLNGLNILNTLDLRSNLEDFYLDYGDMLTTTLSCDIVVKFRDRRL